MLRNGAKKNVASDSSPDVIYEYSVSFEDEIQIHDTPQVDLSPSMLVSNRKSRIRPELGFATSAGYKHAAHFNASAANRKQIASSRSNKRNPAIEELIVPDSSVVSRGAKEETLPAICCQPLSSRAVVPFVSSAIDLQAAGASYRTKETEVADCSQIAEVPKKRAKTAKTSELPMTADEAGGGNDSPPPRTEVQHAKPGPKGAVVTTKTVKVVQETIGSLGLENEANSDDSNAADASPVEHLLPLEKRALASDVTDCDPAKKAEKVKSTVISEMPLGEDQAAEPAKPRRGRGRPRRGFEKKSQKRKVSVSKPAAQLGTDVMTVSEATQPVKARRGRGRPRKMKGEVPIGKPADQQETGGISKVDVTTEEKETNLEDSWVTRKAAAVVDYLQLSDEDISPSRKPKKPRNVLSKHVPRSPAKSDLNIPNSANSVTGTEQPTVHKQERDATGRCEIKDDGTQKWQAEMVDESERRKKSQPSKRDLDNREKKKPASRVKNATVVRPLQLEPKLARILGMPTKAQDEEVKVPDEAEIEIAEPPSELPANNGQDDVPLPCSATEEGNARSSTPDCASGHAAKAPAATTASDTTRNNVHMAAKVKAQRAAKASKSRKKADNLATNFPSNLVDLALPTKDSGKEFGSEGHPKISTAALERIANAGGCRSEKWIGCHVSAYGGVVNAVRNAAETGCFSFAFFLRSPRSWIAKGLTDEVVQEFKDTMNKYGYLPSQVLPHGSYLLNVGSADHEKWSKSRDTLLDEARRCERLGLQLYNFHPGSAVGGGTTEECIGRIAKAINYVIDNTGSLIILVETMCGQGKTVGGSFAELRAIIDLVENKSRIGVCFDTCHVWAAGYDIKSDEGYAETMWEFEHIVGLEYLKAVHLNDSIKTKGGHLDRHERIGKGTIGTEGFWNIMNDSRFNGMPMVLETPDGSIYTNEIELLYKLES